MKQDIFERIQEEMNKSKQTIIKEK